jgi:uncharacterized protein with HEPN domain
MSKRDYTLFLIDILECIERIEKYTNKISLKQFLKNDQAIDSVVRNLEIIGEAAKNIPRDIRKQAPGIPWKKIVGFRNILVHEYYNVDLDNTWHIIDKQLPVLKKQGHVLLKEIKSKK